MYLTHDDSINEYEEYSSSDAEGVFRNRLLNEDNSSKRFALRTFIIKPGGYTPKHTHEQEHGVYIMEGNVKVLVDDKLLNLVAGDVIHIGSNELHQFTNDGSVDVKFLCVRDYLIS